MGIAEHHTGCTTTAAISCEQTRRSVPVTHLKEKVLKRDHIAPCFALCVETFDTRVRRKIFTLWSSKSAVERCSLFLLQCRIRGRKYDHGAFFQENSVEQISVSKMMIQLIRVIFSVCSASCWKLTRLLASVANDD